MLLAAGFVIQTNRSDISLATPAGGAVEQAETDTLQLPARGRHNLPPHSAKVKAEIVNYEIDTKHRFVVLEIKEILGYGASTPRIYRGQVMITDANAYFSASERKPPWIENGSTAVALISPILTIDRDGDTTDTAWSIVELNEYRQTD